MPGERSEGEARSKEGEPKPHLQAERELQDQAIASWALQQGVPPGEVLSARSKQGLLSLAESFMILDVFSLAEVGELLEHVGELSCPQCAARYRIAVALHEHARRLTCPACLASFEQEALDDDDADDLEEPTSVVARAILPRGEAAAEEWLRAELFARWAIFSQQLPRETVLEAWEEALPLEEALLLRDVLGMADVMEVLERDVEVPCRRCEAKYAVPALLAEDLAVRCPECQGELGSAEDRGEVGELLPRRGESDQDWLEAQLFATWAVEEGADLEEVHELWRRADAATPFHERLVVANMLGLAVMMEVLEETAQVGCECGAIFEVPIALARYVTGLPCPSCEVGLELPLALTQPRESTPFSLVDALRVLDDGGTRTVRANLGPKTKGDDAPTRVGSSSERTRAVSPRQHRNIGPYRLDYLIGRGGMGEVWAARDGDRKVALKVMDAHTRAGQEFLVRFEREGEALAALDHPNVVRCLDQGTDELTGASYLALELVTGADLAAVLANREEGQLKVEEGVLLLERCARALGAAHAKAIIHRDIKPSNVLVTPGGDVKLTDFGISLASDVSQRLTRADEVVGTPHYLAPEVLIEGSESWAPAADIYALGCLAFRVLSGRTLFQEHGLGRLLEAHKSQEPPELTDVVPRAPSSLARLVRRMLSKDPAERPTAEEVVEELQALVPDHQTVAGLQLWAQVATLTQRPGGTGRSSTTGLQAGQFFQHYRIVEELGAGGMGVVYRAFHTGLKKTVALKVLLSGALASDDERRRFLREAEAAGALQHPTIVPVLDAGEHEGIYYLTMEFVDGLPLGDYYKQTEDRETLIRLLSRVCDGIAHAHSRGVIHRDIKPDNILVDQDGEPHILDFGIAKKIDDDNTQAGNLTTEGDILGTLRYMPPEQAAGQVQDVDVRSDVYALGAILYEMVTGGTTVFNGSMREILHQILFVEARAPSLNAEGIDVPWELDAICLKALEKERDERYQSSQEFKRDLENFLEGRPIVARQATLGYRLRKWAQRNRRKAIAAAALFLAAVGLLGAYLQERSEREAARRGKILAAARATWTYVAKGHHQKAATSLGVARSLIRDDETLLLESTVIPEIPREVQANLEQQHGQPRVTVYSLKRWAEYVEQQRVSAEAQATIERSLGEARQALVLGRPEWALEPFQVSRKLNPRNPQVLSLQQDLARAFLSRADALVTSAARRARAGGDFDARQQELDAARAAYEGARQVDREGKEAVDGLAQVGLDLARLAEDRRRAKELKRAQGRHAKALVALKRGREAFEGGKLDAAGAELARAREQLLEAIFLWRELEVAREAWVEVSLALGELALRQEKLELAEQHLGHARKGPGGRVYEGAKVKAIAAFAKRLQQLDRDAQAFAAAKKRGDEAYQREAFGKAQAAYQQALNHRRDPAVARRHALCRELVRAANALRLEDRRAALLRAQALHPDPRSLELRIEGLDDQLYRRAIAAAQAAHERATVNAAGWNAVAALYERALVYRRDDPVATRGRADVYAQRDCPKGMVLVSVALEKLARGSVRRGGGAARRFYVDRTEVSNTAFARFVRAKGYATRRLWSAAGWKQRRRFVDTTGRPGPRGWVNGRPQTGTGELPVTGVSFHEAQAFAAWRQGRLPSEEEWLLAACFDPATAQYRAYPWGKKLLEARVASRERLMPVGATPEDVSQPWGLHDMGLNAYEWVVGSGAAKRPTVRGHSFRSFEHDLQQGVLAWHKRPRGAFRDGSLGFRCARDVAAPPPYVPPEGNK